MPTKGTSHVALPRGGGALHRICEKFSLDLFTGTCNLTVPIGLAAGRNGFLPELNLVYNTADGNGPYGLGWRLGVPRANRNTLKGIPRYNLDDTFILSEAQALVAVTGRNGGTRYRPRKHLRFRVHHTGSQAFGNGIPTEELFQKFEKSCDGDIVFKRNLTPLSSPRTRAPFRRLGRRLTPTRKSSTGHSRIESGIILKT